MSQLYSFAAISKQGFHQHLLKEREQQQLRAELLWMIGLIRKDHPRMSAREIYHKLAPAGMGRDAFEAMVLEHGLGVKKVQNYRRTTNSSGVIRFPNLIAGRELTDINQVWVSDITYFEVGGCFHYITFIMDLYSRLVLAAHLSKSLRTETTTIPALKQALQYRQRKQLEGLVLHSDGGGQYYCKALLLLTKTAGIINSMCDVVYDNAHAERLNGIIKNDYLIPYAPACFEQATRALRRAVYLYNHERRHQGIGKKVPYEFEQDLKQIGSKKRKVLKVSESLSTAPKSKVKGS